MAICRAVFRQNGRSHEFAAFEGGDVGGVEVEPFAVFALGGEAGMPIGFDAGRVVGGNDVNGEQRFGKLKTQLILSAARGVAAANLEKLA